MTEKRDINNELILMKKTIQQAKICVIRKLIRKLKNIKSNHEKAPNGLKLIGKSSKLTDQINYLKKIPNLELATLALTFDKNPTKILTNHSSSVEDTSLANIVTFEGIRTKVNEMKIKFGLVHDGGNWRESLREIGKKKKRKIKKETQMKRKENEKKIKETAKKRGEWLVENIDTSEITIGDVKVENIEEPTKIEKNMKKTSKDHSTPNDATRRKVDKSGTPTKLEKSTKKKPKDDSNPDYYKSRKNEPLHNKKKSEPIKTVDPFFITGSGANYLATAVIDRIQPNGPTDGLDRKERRAQKFGIKPKAISQRNNKPFNMRETPRAAARFTDNAKNKGDDLHPSWAARMKTKGIDKFQGKKIKFDDEEESASVGKSSFPTSQTHPEKLHPSWAAKQKLKPIISEFKGNKIIFND